MGLLDKYLEEYQKAQPKEKGDFVTKVACAREVRDMLLPSSSNNNQKNNISFVRASNKCDKLPDCDSCPAAGFWDYIGPGRWCFHTAYFLGKAGKPVHCDNAKHHCPLMATNTVA